MKLTIEKGNVNRTYTTSSIIPLVVIDQLSRWETDDAFLKIISLIPVGEKDKNWKAGDKAAMITKLAIIAIKAADGRDEIYNKIIAELPSDVVGEFNRDWWDNVTEFNAVERSILATYTRGETKDVYRNEAAEIWALVRVMMPDSAGRLVADHLAGTYESYLLGIIDVVETAGVFASVGKISNVIFSYLPIDEPLLNVYQTRPGSASKFSVSKQVILATAVVIKADSQDEALSQLNCAIDDVASSLKNQIMEQWPK
tara:strand:- start:3662 stop:4429 length:768 start_codon:yes stop_codon:yes gene_type:complete